MVVRDRAQRPPRAGLVEEHGENRHQPRCDPGRDEVEFADVHPGLVRQPFDRLVGDTQVERVHLRAPQELRNPFDEESKAYGRHEKRDLRLVDQRPQHHALGKKRERHHRR